VVNICAYKLGDSFAVLTVKENAFKKRDRENPNKGKTKRKSKIRGIKCHTNPIYKWSTIRTDGVIEN